MNLLIYKRFIKYARLQAVFLGGIGVALLLFPKFLLGSMFYVIVGYIILSGVLLIIDFIREKTTKSILNYGSLVLASLLIVFGCTSIVFSRYLVNVSPIYLGALLLIKAVIYFVIALCATTFWQKSILTIFASIALLGGMAVVIFTFGFGIGGIVGLTRVSGFASLLSCIYILVAYLIHKRC
ncbi:MULTISPECIES: hypothetical protein [unclassified Clostridioides]|uniref:hypothetical protein n=1 Tax=unclassified Clostridioides TaxID=2635829 RepID=UPI001D10105E|nr:hypothetical protein [Clostridioides sp. ES-S-0171-01]MCC0688492.1 hypothetical protein [Clostridioides sp. ES-S-0056-01]MCC0713542.1 hypothetical protein [Clostridioides sp. ES-S-0077-01]UDN55514.1 hypothetical protein JJC02_04855 [Clostridioides sp. ES-S-0054-01]